MSPDLTRRGFIVGVGVVGSGMARTARAATVPPPGTSGPYYYRPSPRTGRRLVRCDVCVYGGTSAGVIAAVQAARLGSSVVLVAFGRHLGGMTAGGLGFTDVGAAASIGGLSREFYQRIGAHYGTAVAFTFEPHVAEQVFEDWLTEYHVAVYREQHLVGVDRADRAIREIAMESGLAIQAGAFVDATYEGDLMAMAGVSYTVGREGDQVYGETWNGYHISTNHQFKVPIDPYRVAGNPGSGLLPLISPAAPGTTGAGDKRVQAYNFRLCLTRAADRLPFPQPPGYEAGRYQLLLRYLQAGVWDVFGNNQLLPNGKSDLNNNGAVATDNIGAADRWPEGHYQERERIFQDHVRYQQGLLYFLASDPQVPQNVHDQVTAWGLASDEFTDTAGWPHELYVREGRRMISSYVMTEHNCLGAVVAEDPVGLASYTMDSHNCERIVIDGHPVNEGNVETGVPAPYPISYRAIVPTAAECTNLAVPVALSASHIGYGSIRLEPVYMILGHAAGTAAAQGAAAGAPLQSLDYPALQAQLLADGAILQWPPPAGPFSVTTARAVRAGATAAVTSTLRNTQNGPITGVTLSLTGPAGWAVEATSPTTFGTVEEGDGVSATWKATAPSPDQPLALQVLQGEATYTGPAGTADNQAEADLYVEQPVGDPYRTFAATEAYFGERGSRLGIAAAGTDLYTEADQYGAIYLHAAAGSNAVLETILISQDPTSPNARAGLMVRDDVTGAGSSPGYVVVCAKPQNGFLLLWDADGNGYVESVARADTGTTPYPAWLRLERNGTTATGYYSTDGTTWNVIGHATLPSAAEWQDAAVFATSHDPSIGLVVFDNFTVANNP